MLLDLDRLKIYLLGVYLVAVIPLGVVRLAVDCRCSFVATSLIRLLDMSVGHQLLSVTDELGVEYLVNRAMECIPVEVRTLTALVWAVQLPERLVGHYARFGGFLASGLLVLVVGNPFGVGCTALEVGETMVLLTHILWWPPLLMESNHAAPCELLQRLLLSLP